MHIENLPYSGWQNNLFLRNDHAEVVITLDVGPRIISYRTPGGANVFKEYPEQIGTTGEAEWKIRGGHRLWSAPEDDACYALDNGPIVHTSSATGATFETPPSGTEGRAALRRRLTVSLDARSNRVSLRHELINEGSAPVEAASWALSVMAPGGLELIPLPAITTHPEGLLPRRVIVPWPYTDMTDPRLRFGWRFITVRQTADAGPTKIGLLHRERWVGYLNGTSLFVKTFEHEEGATYPDLGCNFETYTDSNMLEIESLGALRTLAPGESTAHTETWHLLENVPQPSSLKEEELAAWIAPLLAEIGVQ